MPQQIQIDPSQVDQYLAQWRSELEAVTYVLSLKSQAMDHLEKMTDCMAGLESPMSTAMTHFAQVQKLEYSMQIKGFMEKKSQLEEMIKKLEDRGGIVSPASSFKVPTFPPSGGRRQ